MKYHKAINIKEFTRQLIFFIFSAILIIKSIFQDGIQFRMLFF